MPKPSEPGESQLRDPHPSGRPTIFGLQALRFIAAAMVVMTHTLNREVVLYANPPVPRAAWMESGVDIFFVISGFIMVYIIKPETRPGPFWLQRFTRIAPLYWVATAIAFVGGLVLPEWFFGRQDFWFALRSALFLPMGADPDLHPIISPGWTLIYEFGFYTLLAFCMLVARPPFLASITIIVIYFAFSALATVLGWPGGLTYYAAGLLTIEFLFGIAAAVLAARLSLNPWYGLGLAVLGLILIYVMWYMPAGHGAAALFTARGIAIGTPALLTVIGILVSEPLWQRYGAMTWFARLGDASYSIYIVHFFFVTALTTLLQKVPALRELLGPYGFIVLGMVLGLGSGLLAHIYIERPLLALVRSWLPRRRPAARIAAPAKV
jgi:exopolysaccharide production protein ExoZ